MKRYLVLPMVLMVLTTAGLNPAVVRAVEFEPGITLITTAELKSRMDVGDRMLLINTLSPIEHRDKAIPGSVGMPYEFIKDGRSQLPAEKGSMLVFYCKGPKWTKSPQAARLAVKKGYTNVYLYKEGLAGWGKAGYGFERQEALPRTRVNLIKPDELSGKVESDPSIVIIDIRDDEVYQALRLPYEKVIHIPLAYLEERLSEVPRDRKIVVACHHGKQSMTAVPWLKEKGFDVAGCLEGGIMGWQKAGQPVQN